jgi:hypothetical protein
MMSDMLLLSLNRVSVALFGLLFAVLVMTDVFVESVFTFTPDDMVLRVGGPLLLVWVVTEGMIVRRSHGFVWKHRKLAATFFLTPVLVVMASGRGVQFFAPALISPLFTSSYIQMMLINMVVVMIVAQVAVLAMVFYLKRML